MDFFSPPHHQKENLIGKEKKIANFFINLKTCILLPLHHKKENVKEKNKSSKFVTHVV